tara:strand:- start:161 stop:571 length:411 start_codon:yes stop_codon:yes gene_type:complete
MQTFLPYKSFNESFKVLDYRRLGKQRVEAYQILNVLLGRTKTKGWVNHPATKMWKGYENALKQYLNECIDHWVSRGYNNNMKKEVIEGDIVYPHWLGDDDFHSAHRSNLLRKDKEFYSQYMWTESDNMEYYWPITN